MHMSSRIGQDLLAEAAARVAHDDAHLVLADPEQSSQEHPHFVQAPVSPLHTVSSSPDHSATIPRVSMGTGAYACCWIVSRTSWAAEVEHRNQLVRAVAPPSAPATFPGYCSCTALGALLRRT